MIVYTWHGITQHAVRCLREYIQSTSEKVVVISMPNDTPANKLEETLGQKIIWAEETDLRSIVEIAGSMPRAFIAEGWVTPCIRRWNDEVRSAGGITCVTPDDSIGVFSFGKDVLRAIRYRIFLRKLFSKVFVCGAGGRKFFRMCGVKDDNIYEGLCSCDNKVFYNGLPLSKRAKKIIYVGRYIQLKNVIRMIDAFTIASKKYSGWELELYGNGELKEELKRIAPKNVHINDYAQTDQLGDLYRSAQIFVLGSWHDNWGAVAHEAALCGCLQLLSRHVGAHFDFAKRGNSAVFNPFSTKDFARAMEKLMAMSDAEKDKGQEISLEAAAKFSPKVFADNLKRIVE